jgi:PhzF family phenazine biosynthesis protein
MQVKTKATDLTQHKPSWLMLRFIKHAASQAVFFSHKNNLAGASALVIIYQYGLSTKMMQHIASRSAHPATVFLNQHEMTKAVCQIRWFNQSSEIKRCGHGTLAAANVLIKQYGYCPRVFISQSNERFTINIKKQQAQLILNAIEIQQSDDAAQLQRAFSLPIQATYRSVGQQGYTIALFTQHADLRNLQVNFNALADLHNNAIVALQVIKSVQHTSTANFRYFAPQFGVNEDSATGSAVSVIAPLIYRLYGLNKITLCQQSNQGALLNYNFNHNQIVIN